MISNFDLEKIADDMHLDLIGVFSKDNLPKERIVGSYIINLQDQDDGGGTHWTAFKIFPMKQACYFDSFGFDAPVEVGRFLEPFKPIATNNRQIQAVKSDLCGYFCLAFIDFMNDKRGAEIYDKYDDFLNSFTNNLKSNDKIVMEMLQM
tara:strand:+ start:2278 stop:2724 length:447 start_codon:yes stop_codon:yes gene_type:complete